MAKPAAKKHPKRIDGYRIAGVTKDGVYILKGPPATHFTAAELSKAVATARRQLQDKERVKRAG